MFSTEISVKSTKMSVHSCKVCFANVPLQLKCMLDIPQMRPFSQRPWRNCGAAAVEGKFSLVGARWTRAGSDFAHAWVLAGGMS